MVLDCFGLALEVVRCFLYHTSVIDEETILTKYLQNYKTGYASTSAI